MVHIAKVRGTLQWVKDPGDPGYDPNAPQGTFFAQGTPPEGPNPLAPQGHAIPRGTPLYSNGMPSAQLAGAQTMAPSADVIAAAEQQYQQTGNPVYVALPNTPNAGPLGGVYHRTADGQWLPPGLNPYLGRPGWTSRVDPTTGQWVGKQPDTEGLFGLKDWQSGLLLGGLIIGGGLGAGAALGGLSVGGAAAGAAGGAGEVGAGVAGAGEVGAGVAGAGEAGVGVAGAGEAGVGAGLGGAGVAGAGEVFGPPSTLAGGVAGGVLGTLKDIAPIGGPLLSAGSSLAGGFLGAGAAKDAAGIQADAARQADATLMQIYQQGRQDLAPYREAGYQALGQLQDLEGQPLSYDPYSAPAALDPGQYAFDPNQYAFNAPVQPLDPNQYAFNAPVQPLDPKQYAFTPPSGQEVLNQDPGYQFRLDQGMKAIQQSAAAKGGLLSGAMLKGTQRFGQGLASQEYQNAYQRSLGQNELTYNRAFAQNEQTYGRSLAENQQAYQRAYQQNQDIYGRGLTENEMKYERGLQGNQLSYQRGYQQNQDAYQRALGEYQTNRQTLLAIRQQRFNELASLAGTGQTAGQATAQLGANLGTNVAGNITSAGAAQAAGQVGAANALGSGLSGIGNAANSYLNYSLLQNLLAQNR